MAGERFDTTEQVAVETTGEAGWTVAVAALLLPTTALVAIGLGIHVFATETAPCGAALHLSRALMFSGATGGACLGISFAHTPPTRLFGAIGGAIGAGLLTGAAAAIIFQRCW